MKRKDDPEVVDLHRYRKAAEEKKAEERAARAARAKAAKQGRKQGVLGSRPGAPFILAAVVLFLLALWLGPRLL